MHGVETYERIRRAHFIEGKGIRRIARESGIHRRVVREAIADATPQAYERNGPPVDGALTEHHEWIDGVLLADKKVPRKQRHTAKRIFQRLVEERKYTGGESTVRRHVALRKMELGIDQPEIYVPLDHPPGRDGQADWGQALVKINGEAWNARVLTVTSCYSGAPFVQAYPIEKQEAFLEGLLRSFEFFGGVFHRIAFDNLRTAVKKVLEGRSRIEQEGFIAFRSHHLFESFFCRVGKSGAHEKGAVEGQVGYGRRNFMVPIPDQPTWTALNEYLADQCRKELQRTARDKQDSIGTLLERERPLMLPLPPHRFDVGRKIFLRADSHSRIRVDTIRYSVPADYAHRDLTVKVYVGEVVVAWQDQIIARHRRRFSPGEQELDPLHYVPILHKKPHVLDWGLPFASWRLPAVFSKLRQKLEENDPRGLREYVRVLQAIPHCNVHSVACAIDEALRGGRADADAVLERLAARGIRVPSKSQARSELKVADPNVKQYDQLLNKENNDGNHSASEGVPETAAPAGHGA